MPPDERAATLVKVLDAGTMSIRSHDSISERGYIRIAGLVRRVPQIRSFDDDDSYVLGGSLFEVVIENWDCDDEAMHCMPLFVCHSNSYTFTECLLLQELYPGGSEYIRVELLKVPLDEETEELPLEIRWVAEYSMLELSEREQGVITIY